MKINWNQRFKNKAWLLAFITAFIAFAYQICGLFGIVPKFEESQIMELVKIILTMLVGLGIIVDPTTAGIKDSDRAMTYGHEEIEMSDIHEA